MQITSQQLRTIMPRASKQAIETYLPLINKYSADFGINTRMQLCHFLAEIAVESAELNYTVENLNYSAQGLLKTFPRYFNADSASRYQRNQQMIANRVYANRMGNGSEASGDGYRYRGRGLIQITGRDNYKAYNNYLTKQGMSVDLISHPELLQQPLGALKSAMWFFVKSGCNNAANLDTGASTDKTIEVIRRKVNGGRNGLNEAKTYFLRAKLAIK